MHGRSCLPATWAEESFESAKDDSPSSSALSLREEAVEHFLNNADQLFKKLEKDTDNGSPGVLTRDEIAAAEKAGELSGDAALLLDILRWHFNSIESLSKDETAGISSRDMEVFKELEQLDRDEFSFDVLTQMLEKRFADVDSSGDGALSREELNALKNREGSSARLKEAIDVLLARFAALEKCNIVDPVKGGISKADLARVTSDRAVREKTFASSAKTDARLPDGLFLICHDVWQNLSRQK